MLTKKIETKLRHVAGVRLVETFDLPKEITDLISLLLNSQVASVSHRGPSKYLGRYSALVDYRILDGLIEWEVAYANADKPTEEAFAYATSVGINLHYNQGGSGSLPSIYATKKYSLSNKEYEVASKLATNGGYIEIIPEGMLKVKAASGFDSENYQISEEHRRALERNPRAIGKITEPKIVELPYGSEFLKRRMRKGVPQFQTTVVLSKIAPDGQAVLFAQAVDTWVNLSTESMSLDY